MFGLLLTAALAALVVCRSRRWRTAVVVLVLAYAWTPLAVVAALLWEPYQASMPKDVGAIVVLAGAVHDPIAPVAEPLLGHSTYERCVYAAQLYHEVGGMRVIVSGGTIPPAPTAYADAMRRELVRRGVRPQHILMERQSRSTYENALYSAKLLEANNVTKIALVTSATHMRRAAAAFRHQGIAVAPAACAYRSTYDLELGDVLWPNRTAISWNDELAHEFFGFAWYRLRGRL
jgi:uncharacterized SAM-binding protein YcdF (DUF218 family)